LGYWAALRPADNRLVRAHRPGSILRVWLALLIALAQLNALVPAAGAQEIEAERVRATWTPKTLGSKEIAAASCPATPDEEAVIVRGVVYETCVTVQFDQPVQPMIIEPVANGLEITATSRATGADVTRALAPGQAETIDISIVVPEANPRNTRDFYLGRIVLLGGSASVSGALTISVTVPKPRISWGRIQLTDGSRDAAPLQTIVGSGATFTRRVALTSSLDVEDFAIRSNSDRLTVSGVPTSLPGGEPQNLLLTFRAPIVNRRTRMEVHLMPASGITPLAGTMRMRVLVLPVTVSWGPPQVRATLNVEDQAALEKTLTITSNYDIPNVQFRTQDVGLTPILSPTGLVNLRAGVPQQVRVRLCPGYAPTTYFLGLTAYQGSKPLNQRLQIRMTVEGDPAKVQPLPEGALDPCAAP
jgi:hypothetical protein